MHIRFDVIISADAFEKLKPAPDIFLAASKSLDVPQSQVYGVSKNCCNPFKYYFLPKLLLTFVLILLM